MNSVAFVGNHASDWRGLIEKSELVRGTATVLARELDRLVRILCKEDTCVKHYRIPGVVPFDFA